MRNMLVGFATPSRSGMKPAAATMTSWVVCVRPGHHAAGPVGRHEQRSDAERVLEPPVDPLLAHVREEAQSGLVQVEKDGWVPGDRRSPCPVRSTPHTLRGRLGAGRVPEQDGDGHPLVESGARGAQDVLLAGLGQHHPLRRQPGARGQNIHQLRSLSSHQALQGRGAGRAQAAGGLGHVLAGLCRSRRAACPPARPPLPRAGS